MRQRIIRIGLLFILLLFPFNACPATASPPPPGISATTPSFTKGPNQYIDVNAGPKSVLDWATNIVTTTGECAFLVSTNLKGLFTVWPDVDLDGTLTYTPAIDARGRAIVTIYLGCGYPDTIESAHQTFEIVIDQHYWLDLPAVLK